MRLFVSEFLCSGACADICRHPSLLREGRAMLNAIVADFAALDGVSVVTTWDQRLGAPALPAETVLVASPEEEATLFRRLCPECDAAYVIAPELGHELAARCRSVTELGGEGWNSSLDAIELCSDKLALADHFLRHAVATLATRPFQQTPAPTFDFPIVVKPRWGAGSQDVFLVRAAAEMLDASSRFGAPTAIDAGIVQPYVEGQALSAAALCDGRGGCVVCPTAEQRLSQDGRFAYLGGRIPVDVPCEAAIVSLVRHAVATIPGLRGYVGFDMLIPRDEPADPLIIEVNPRLTTSYLGYRRLCRGNLAAWIARPTLSDPGWFDGCVTFDAAGRAFEDRPPKN